jgi:hypothetical protein
VLGRLFLIKSTACNYVTSPALMISNYTTAFTTLF